MPFMPLPQEQQRQGTGGSLMLFKHSILMVDAEDRAWPVQVGDSLGACAFPTCNASRKQQPHPCSAPCRLPSTAAAPPQQQQQSAAPTMADVLPLPVTPGLPALPRSTKASCQQASATCAWAPGGATSAAPTP